MHWTLDYEDLSQKIARKKEKMRKFVLYSYSSTITATRRATPEAPQMDSYMSLESFNTDFFENSPRTHRE